MSKHAKVRCSGIKVNKEQCSRMVKNKWCHQHRPEGYVDPVNKLSFLEEKPKVTQEELAIASNYDKSVEYIQDSFSSFLQKIEELNIK